MLLFQRVTLLGVFAEVLNLGSTVARNRLLQHVGSAGPISWTWEISNLCRSWGIGIFCNLILAHVILKSFVTFGKPGETPEGSPHSCYDRYLVRFADYCALKHGRRKTAHPSCMFDCDILVSACVSVCE